MIKEIKYTLGHILSGTEQNQNGRELVLSWMSTSHANITYGKINRIWNDTTRALVRRTCTTPADPPRVFIVVVTSTSPFWWLYGLAETERRLEGSDVFFFFFFWSNCYGEKEKKTLYIVVHCTTLQKISPDLEIKFDTLLHSQNYLFENSLIISNHTLLMLKIKIKSPMGHTTQLRNSSNQ